MDQSDEQLAIALRDGDAVALRVLFDRYEVPMRRVAKRIVASEEDAEDAVADAFVSMYRRIETYRGDASFRAWFYRIVVRAAHKRRRSHLVRVRSDQEVGELVGPPQTDPSDAEAVRALDQEVGQLPAQQRLVFQLSAVEGLPPREIAEIMDLEASTVRYHLSAAKDRLRERLARFVQSAWLRPLKVSGTADRGPR